MLIKDKLIDRNIFIRIWQFATKIKMLNEIAIYIKRVKYNILLISVSLEKKDKFDKFLLQ